MSGPKCASWPGGETHGRRCATTQHRSVHRSFGARRCGHWKPGACDQRHRKHSRERRLLRRHWTRTWEASMNETCTETIDRELTETELGHVVGGRKAGENPQEYLS